MEHTSNYFIYLTIRFLCLISVFEFDLIPGELQLKLYFLKKMKFIGQFFPKEMLPPFDG